MGQWCIEETSYVSRSYTPTTLFLSETVGPSPGSDVLADYTDVGLLRASRPSRRRRR